MPRKKLKSPFEILTASVQEAMLEKLARQPVMLGFSKMGGSVCDAFLICHGNSRTQVEAIAENVIEKVKKNTGLNPWHKEGTENAEWILIDYSDVVVHIFQEERRKFYNLEQLWGDAEITKISEKS